MKIKKRIAIIGAGNIGLSIAEGLCSKKVFSEKVIVTRRKNNFSETEKEMFYCLNNNEEALHKAGIVILAVKPKQFDELAKEINKSILENQLIISVITGLTIENISLALPNAKAVVRIMPNTAGQVGQSMSFCSFNPEGEKHKTLVERIFNSIGKTLVIPEAMFDSATVLSGSGIALVLKFIRAYMQAGIQSGFNEKDSLLIAKEVCKGAVELLDHNGTHPEVEIDKVTSPGGCTIDALSELEHRGFTSSLLKAIRMGIEKASSLYTKK